MDLPTRGLNKLPSIANQSERQSARWFARRSEWQDLLQNLFGSHGFQIRLGAPVVLPFGLQLGNQISGPDTRKSPGWRKAGLAGRLLQTGFGTIPSLMDPFVSQHGDRALQQSNFWTMPESKQNCVSRNGKLPTTISNFLGEHHQNVGNEKNAHLLPAIVLTFQPAPVAVHATSGLSAPRCPRKVIAHVARVSLLRTLTIGYHLDTPPSKKKDLLLSRKKKTILQRSCRESHPLNWFCGSNTTGPDVAEPTSEAITADDHHAAATILGHPA